MRFRGRFIGAVVGAVMVGVVVAAVVVAPTVAGASSRHASRAPQEDFMFQVMHFHTADQGGDTFNFYLHYAYRSGLPTSKYPNFVTMRQMLLDYMKPKRSQYIEILNTHICTTLMNSFPISAISCQFQAYNGVDPGYRSSIVTIGNIAPLAIPKP